MNSEVMHSHNIHPPHFLPFFLPLKPFQGSTHSSIPSCHNFTKFEENKRDRKKGKKEQKHKERKVKRAHHINNKNVRYLKTYIKYNNLSKSLGQHGFTISLSAAASSSPSRVSVPPYRRRTRRSLPQEKSSICTSSCFHNR